MNVLNAILLIAVGCLALVSSNEEVAEVIQQQFIVKRSGGNGYTDFSQDEIDAIVARHNYHRANTNPSAANMLEMVSFILK